MITSECCLTFHTPDSPHRIDNKGSENVDDQSNSFVLRQGAVSDQLMDTANMLEHVHTTVVKPAQEQAVSLFLVNVDVMCCSCESKHLDPLLIDLNTATQPDGMKGILAKTALFQITSWCLLEIVLAI